MDIKAREAEFRKENAKLELKTKELLNKVEDVMKIQENWIEYTFQNDERIKPNDLNLPKSVDEMGNKGMIQFYKSKLKTLQFEHGKMEMDLKNKSEELKKVQKSYDTVSLEKEKWLLQYNCEKNTNTKLEKQISLANSKSALKDTEILALKKQIQELQNELKSVLSENTTRENRLKIVIQENDKIKSTIQSLREQEKKTKDSQLQNIKELTSAIKQLQKQKNEILHGYKRQSQLINNLKKQKFHIESSKVLEIGEQDFMRLLDFKLD